MPTRGRGRRSVSGKLFPHFICRVAGFPVAWLDELGMTEAVALAGELLELEEVQAAARESLTEALYDAVGGTEDAELRAALIHLKRDVHNLRDPDPDELELARAGLPEQAHAELVAFAERRGRCDDLVARFETAFEAERKNVREHFRRRLAHPDFQKGVLLSSQVLSRQTSRYLEADLDGLRSKERQIERSLLRYFSRMVMKTTPFGTFCAISPGRFLEPGEASAASPAADGSLRFDGDPQAKESRLRLNKGLYAQLLGRLLRRPAVRRRLDVELNPTLSRDDGRWLFLTAGDGAELFQRLPDQPVLGLIRDLAAGSADRPHRPLEGIAGDLAAHPDLDTSEDEALAYLERLLEIGFLRFRIGIPEQEVDWDGPLREILEPIDDDEARRARDLLGRLRSDLEAYAEAPVPERRKLLRRMDEAVREALEGAPAMAFGGPALPFFEDARGSASLPVAAEVRESLEEVLDEWVGKTAHLALPRPELAAMRHFFDTYYDGSARVPLLRFYEDFYREHFKEHLEKQQAGRREVPQEEGADEAQDENGGEGRDREDGVADEYDAANPFALDRVAAFWKARERLLKRVRARWADDPEAEEVRLDGDDLDAVLDGVEERSHEALSVSLFVQPLPGFGPNGEPALVASDYLNGYGKYFSRFLYLLPEEVTRDLQDRSRTLTGDDVAEILGDQSFNANLHPPLLPKEISYPTGETGASEAQVPSSELAVGPEPDDAGAVALFHAPTGRRIHPVDLGFLNPRMRPPLFQLLSRFTPPGRFFLKLSDDPDPENPPEVPVLVRPRVTYRGRLVLARRRWTLSPASFPERRDHETDAEYFLRVQRVRRVVGWPREAYVRVRPRFPQKAGDETKNAPIRRHLHKPQYVDFHNPLLVDLFGRSTENLPDYRVHLEECLPGRGQRAKDAQGHGYATEWVLQLDFREDPP